MKILAISNLYPPNAVGGYEALCFDVMQALASRGHDVTVLTSNYGDKVELFADQKVTRDLTLLATQGNIYEPFACSEAIRTRINQDNIDHLKVALSAEPPDVIFVWNLHFLDQSFLAAVKESTPRKVFLLTDNWLIAFCNPNFIAEYFALKVYAAGGGPLRLPRHLLGLITQSKGGLMNVCRRIGRYLLPSRRQSHLFSGSAIFASRFMHELYSQAGVGFAEQTIIHHGTTPLPQPKNSRPDRSQFLKENELSLLLAGRIVEIKGVHTAVDALPTIIQQMPGTRVRLTILGDNRDQPYVDGLHQRVRALGLESVVSFSPPVAEKELPDLFQQHDIYLFPSLYEPFALTLIHALRAGIPTVASNAGGTPEIVFQRETGMLFRAGDSADLAQQVVALAASAELRRTISQRSTAHAEGFTFNRMVNDVESHLKAIAEVSP
jgi:glycogen(starch) synthase